MRRMVVAGACGVVALLTGATAAGACGGLIGRNGAVNVLRTTTLAAYHDGIEHYVTSFKFAGVGGEFGSIVPLPGVPSAVERGGDWTLQRLVKEVSPVRRDSVTAAAASSDAASRAPAEVVLEKRVDALDLTVLKGGAQAVGQWATEHGFNLTPDAPEVLEFYAHRSPIFLAARFDANAAQARGVALGDGTPVHLTIPTSNPWVPLRILALGRAPGERIEADVFLLTDGVPSLLPGDDAPGIEVDRFGAASASLLADLRSDRGMEWLPASMQLTHVRVDAAPKHLVYDLAVDASGSGEPSPQAAGLAVPAAAGPEPGGIGMGPVLVVAGGVGLILAMAGITLGVARRTDR